MYPVVLEPDDNGTVLVTCPDLPEVTTWGEDEQDALRHAADAIAEALAGIITRRERIPQASRPSARAGSARSKRAAVHVPVLAPLVEAKIALYRAAFDAGVSKAELGRRLGWHAPQVDRLFDLNHRSRIEQIDQALRALGKRISVSAQDAA
jgi:antitoxin HicB